MTENDLKMKTSESSVFRVKITQPGRKKLMVRMPKADIVKLFAKIQDTPRGSCGDKDVSPLFYILIGI